MALRLFRATLWLGLLFILHLGCGDSDGPTATGPTDTTAPAAVTDLDTLSTTSSTVTLVWTCPGDDGYSGQVSACEVRYSTQAITEANWTSATLALAISTPKPAGVPDTLEVTGLEAETLYHFAVRTADEVPNWSALSNIVTVTTPPESGGVTDTIPPAVITDLRAALPVSGSVLLQWTAPGDDGTTGTAFAYDLRYSTTEIDESNWAAATVQGTSSPQPAGTNEVLTIYGLENSTLYYFAIKSVDESGNWSALSNVVPFTTDTGAPPPPPQNLQAISGPDGSITLSWGWSASPPSGTLLYIYRSTAPDVMNVSHQTLGPLDPFRVGSYVDTDLVRGRTYYYVAFAWNGDGSSDPSNEVHAECSVTVDSGDILIAHSAGWYEITGIKCLDPQTGVITALLAFSYSNGLPILIDNLVFDPSGQLYYRKRVGGLEDGHLSQLDLDSNLETELNSFADLPYDLNNFIFDSSGDLIAPMNVDGHVEIWRIDKDTFAHSLVDSGGYLANTSEAYVTRRSDGTLYVGCSLGPGDHGVLRIEPQIGVQTRVDGVSYFLPIDNLVFNPQGDLFLTTETGGNYAYVVKVNMTAGTSATLYGDWQRSYGSIAIDGNGDVIAVDNGNRYHQLPANVVRVPAYGGSRVILFTEENYRDVGQMGDVVVVP